ncbi:metallophosphoesterase family protein [Neoroseomonas lacus]|uniref:Metallophosphoesterase n=1 Tax=Neoroseomonas lacus TaxID=287609 RepID=A0A917KUV0_9PROT|nr:metallophosphoesterase [Neoroseomonas lacus]GGJ25884.1 metallophosphoesterase [Neoroseomonas lacus]
MDEPTRRDTLECMLWAGTGLLWSVVGGVPRASLIGTAEAATAAAAGFTFAQVSDSHLGFATPLYNDVAGTTAEALRALGSSTQRPSLVLHTGDVTHLSKAAEFDAAQQIFGGSGLEMRYVPGEHDVIDDDGRAFLERFGRGAGPGGWSSFDAGGIHFIGLNNVVNLQAGGLGQIGAAQLAFLEADLRGRSASQPIVVFAHIPLWTIHAPWGWGTEDSEQAMRLLARFGSVTVLNGHIHQIIQKVEGHVAFHTARSTAFPQPAPGSAPSPGPIRNLPADRLRSVLGVTRVSRVEGNRPLAIIDTPLGA